VTTTSSVGAPGYYPSYQTQAPAQAYGAAAALPPGYVSDGYKPQMATSPQAPAAASAQPQEPYAILNKTDMMLGVGGAVAGFFLAALIGLTGPMGALIFGLGALGLSMAVRGVKHLTEKNSQPQMQAVHPGFQQPMYQNYYSPQSTTMAPSQQPYQSAYPQTAAPAPNAQSMQYAQAYQQYRQPNGAPAYPQQAYPQQPGVNPAAYPQQQSAWDKFLSWL
jgi:hypothetical protein